MNTLKNLIQKYEIFERPNLDAQHAIWEVHSVKIMGFFLGLLMASIFPQITSIPKLYWVIGFVIFAGYPGIMAVLRMKRSNIKS